MVDAASADGPAVASQAGLIYTTPDSPGFGRRRIGCGFSFLGADGRALRDPAVLERVRSLAIPPAWTHVWICPDPNGHLQAIGCDARGRRQYRYHPRFREARESAKFEHMLAFAEALPKLRAQVAAHMALPGLGRDKVLATVVHLLETTTIRVGNAAYAKENKSYGLTTLLARHVQVDGPQLRFHFTGKSGRTWRLGIRDRRVARIVKSCQDLPGQHLFRYLDDAGLPQTVTSADVNAYLRAVSGADITAKDFRTWSGTVLAAAALSELGTAETAAQAKQNVAQAIASVSSHLGNTPTICRKCYVHPRIVEAYLAGALTLTTERAALAPAGQGALRAEEMAVLAFLRDRLAAGEAKAQDPDPSRLRSRRAARSPARVAARPSHSPSMP